MMRSKWGVVFPTEPEYIIRQSRIHKPKKAPAAISVGYKHHLLCLIEPLN